MLCAFRPFDRWCAASKFNSLVPKLGRSFLLKAKQEPVRLLRGNVSLLRPPSSSSQNKMIPLFQRKQFQGNINEAKGCMSYQKTYIPSACILTLHPVILPIPYLIFSHLVQHTAGILCFIFIPCIVVCVCTSKQVQMHVCESVPGAWVDKKGCVSRFLSIALISSDTLTVKLNGLKRSERGILEQHHVRTAQVSLLFVRLISLAGRVCEMSSLEMQENQQSVWLFTCVLCSCFEFLFVFILINPPVLTAPVITKHHFQYS